ncbi:T9SS type A sorting domain-containing protein [Flavobacterium sp. Sd200]|uniref:DUF7619 domain-containing protein n=1 Tax=Flavobacterium sp. Sd200 TaxID=2692211 RepID=UPI00136DF945|nr:T9SS type A sorting domain-containing protein [Flavobacterium sp. Sd200]MXN93019.1 T9SS type A sorting domain-containing protein [Flavobacterium sp. Sd200]
MKKTLFFMFFLMVSGIAGAQIVNIPDVNFKNYLLSDQLSIDTNNDGEIQVSEALEVTSLNVSTSPATTLTSLQGIESFNNLRTLHLSIMNNISVDLTGLSNLTSLDLIGRITSINLTGLTSLSRIAILRDPISSLDLSDSPNLNEVSLQYLNVLTSLELGVQPSLNNFQLISSSLTNIDLSGCSNINLLAIELRNFLDDVYLNLKNGNANYTIDFSFYVNDIQPVSNKIFVCIDEGEADNFINLAENVVLSTYCDFTPGGNHNTITGTVFFDADNNGCDANDLPVSLVAVEISGEISGISFTSNGTYNFYTQVGAFTLTPQFESNWFTVTPATVTFADNNNNTTTQNFCVTANGVHNDAEVIISSLVPARPGFDAEYQIIYKNKGNQALSGNVTLTYDAAVLDYVTASQTPSVTSAGSVTFGYSDLLPFETRAVNVTLNVNSPMETPAVNIGDVLNFTATITPSTGDETPYDNVFNFDQVVVGSYDPNDITCLEGATVSPDKIGEYLHYNINFENTGTAPATFIVVKDVIDTAKYDLSTLQVLYASHPMEARVTGNKVEFYFDDIQLPGEGKGNVTFKIKTLETLAVNSSVTQQADIFFDYNWPIVTNEATTTFAILNAGKFATDNSITVAPNPTDGVIKITAKSEIRSVQLYDVQGRLLQAVHGATIDISNRASGIYFVKVTTDKGAKVEKLLRQ